MTYTTVTTAALLKVSRETIRTWSEEFSRHLSITASPGQGRHRQFTTDDLQIFSLIAELKRQGMTFDDIHIALDNGQRGQLPADDMRALVAGEHRQQIALWEQRVTDLQQQITHAEKQIERQQGTIEELRRQLDDARRDRDTMQDRIDRLNREIGRLSADRDTD